MNLPSFSKKPSKTGKSGSGSGSGSRSSTPSESKSVSKSSSKSSPADNDNVGWCEWEWDPRWRRYWRTREKLDGGWEYDYAYSLPDDDGSTPRFSAFGTGDNLPPIGEEGVGEGEFTLSPPAPGNAQLSTSAPPSAKYSSTVDPDSGCNFDTPPGPIPPLSRNLGNLQISPGLQQDKSLSYGARMPSMTNNAGIPIRGSNPQQNVQEEENYYDDDTVATSTPKPLFAYSTASMPSPYPQTAPSNIAYPAYTSSNAEEPSIPMSPSSEQAPTIGSIVHITAGPTTVTEDSISPKEVALHGNFRVHHANEFEFGRVFKILWTEPKGQGMATRRTEVVPTLHGEDCYTSIRRFVIFKRMLGHCLCLPILTYKRQGTAKGGAKPQDHCIIYTEGKKGEKPKETEYEEKLLKKAIRMEPRSHRDQLDPLSRLNYAKIYTVEYNVKVSFIGRIHKDSVKYFTRDFNLTHGPLPEAENYEYSDDNQGLQQLAERDPVPHSQRERRVSEPPSRHRGSHKEKEQQTREQQDRRKGGR